MSGAPSFSAMRAAFELVQQLSESA